MESSDFKNFWEKMESPAHAHSSEAWFDRYAQEILFFLSGSKTVMDAGCGSGELLMRIAPHFNNVFALDFSESMLEKAKERILTAGIGNVKFACDNITRINKHFPGPVDAIYCNGVIQYLGKDELKEFLVVSRGILSPSGKVVLLNIPNINSRMLFMLGFYKHERRVSFFSVLRGLPALWSKIAMFKLRNRWRQYDDGIGNWYSIEQIKEIAHREGFFVQIYGASVVNYNYRFHAVLTTTGQV